MSLDFEILYFIQEHIVCKALNDIMVFISSLGNYGAIWIITATALIIPKKTRKCGIFILCALTFSLITGEVITKNLVARIRPCNIDLAVNMLIERPKTYSFPSGHSSSSFAATAVIFYFYKKAGLFVLVIASLIAFSRMYLFVHFPTDVICGILWGIISAIIVIVIYKKLFENNSKISIK